MRVIKLGLISVVVFALLITAFSFMFPSHVRISKAININASGDSVLNSINNVQVWKNWYPGFDTLIIKPRDEKKSVVFNNKGIETGVITIDSESHSEVVASIGTNGNRTSINGWKIIRDLYPDSTTVQWYMDFHLRWYPWEKFSSMLLEKRYGPLMERGLGQLKQQLEKVVER